MSITPSSRAHLLAKILKGSMSASDKVVLLLQFGDVFNFAQSAKPDNDEDWEAFRDAEVLDYLLLLATNIEANHTGSMNALVVVLTHLKNLFINPLVATMISSDPQMKAALSNHMPHIVATTHGALQTARGSENAQLASIRMSTLPVIGALLMIPVFKDDEEFLRSLDREKVLSVLLETCFTSEPIPDTIHLGYGATILSCYVKDGVFDNTAIGDILEDHKTEDVVRRCLELFASDTLSVDSMPLGPIHFMLCANHSPKMHRPLVEAGVQKSSIERYWKWINLKRRSEEEMCSCARDMATAINSFLRPLEREECTDLKNRVISEMDPTELVLLLGRTPLGTRSFEFASDDVLSIGRCIADALPNDRKSMESEMKTAYMHCCKCLDDFMYSAPHKDENRGKSPQYEPDKEQPDFTPAIQGWKEFGKLLGFDREKIIAEEAERRKAEMQGIEGCSWFKCCLYRDTKIAPLKEMMRCSACKSAQYCGKRCQRLDWEDGGHKGKCTKRRK